MAVQVGFGWGLFLYDCVDSDEGVLLKGAAEFGSESEAKEAGMKAFDSMLLEGLAHPECLALVVFDEDGEALSESRARRLTNYN